MSYLEIWTSDDLKTIINDSADLSDAIRYLESVGFGGGFGFEYLWSDEFGGWLVSLARDQLCECRDPENCHHFDSGECPPCTCEEGDMHKEWFVKLCNDTKD